LDKKTADEMLISGKFLVNFQAALEVFPFSVMDFFQSMCLATAKFIYHLHFKKNGDIMGMVLSSTLRSNRPISPYHYFVNPKFIPEME